MKSVTLAVALATFALCGATAHATNKALLPDTQVALLVGDRINHQELRHEIHSLIHLGSPHVRLVVKSETAFRNLREVLREFRDAGYDKLKITVD